MQDGQMAPYTELCDYSSEGHKMRNLIKFVIDRCMNLYVYKLRATWLCDELDLVV
jgi:hypothetical protein